jgi:hypothetical protein
LPSKWKNRKRPDLEDLLAQAGQNHQLHDCLIGHLIVESLLVQLIDTDLRMPDVFDAFRIRFHHKVKLCAAMAIIPEELAGFLERLNELRNRFAHRLGYRLSFEDLHALAIEAANVGIEFSDDVHTDKELARETFESQMLLSTVFWRTAHHLACILDDRGGTYPFL